jgi:helicase|tara:strand:- start:8105 stop:10255 length:2151 start_codon:yes stop_codon:yes gene_type:complete
MRIEDLSNYGLPSNVIDVIHDSGISNLYPPQKEAVLNGLLELKRSFIISVPTASGKTLIAEILMIKALIKMKGKCLYVVPLRALAREKFEDFKKYEAIGFRVAISTGDLDSKEGWLENFDLIVATSEKANSLLRHKAGWLSEINVLAVDEIHLINDSRRGPTLEIVITKLLHINPKLLILGLSATINNAAEIASWLNAKLISMDWRPVELREGVFYDDSIFFSDSKLQEVETTCKSQIINLVLETIKDGDQGLIFVNTRRSAERVSLDASKETSKFLKKTESNKLKRLSKLVKGSLEESNKISIRLSKALEGGSAFHHAGLSSKQRKIIEDGFKDNLIKVIVATPTLAAGVNLPARRVVIRDYTRYDVNLGRIKIPILEYKQQAGRAGRPKYDEYGEAVLIARTADERSLLLDNYILGVPEDISSKLAVESTLRTHVLAVIAMDFCNSFYSVVDFFSKTFFVHQNEPSILEDFIQNILEFLVNQGLCKMDKEMIIATKFGKRVSELYIDPISAITLRDGMFQAQKKTTINFSLLHLLSSVTEMGRLYLRKKDYDGCVKEAYQNEKYFLVEMPNQLAEPWIFEDFLTQVKSSMFFQDWINEKNEDYLFNKYNLGQGDIRVKVNLADWILYSAYEIGLLFKFSKLKDILILRNRIRYGVKDNILDLVSLRNIGRARARKLYNADYKTLSDLKIAREEDLARVPLVGRKIAESIKKQLG